MAVLKACPRCRTLIPHGLAYCETCAPIAEAERQAKRERRAEYLNKKYNRAYNAKRAQDDPKYRQFRNSKAWKATSRAKLQECSYRCEAKLEGCQRLACEVHHVEPITTPAGWAKRREWSNLMGVCITCHNILDGKTYKRKKQEGVIDLRDVLTGAPGGGSKSSELFGDNGHRGSSL